MERIVYQRMAELDQLHWWYRARRRILATLIARRIALPREARILEIGCGTGHNFEILAPLGRLDAVELDAEARLLASRRLGHPVLDAPLPGLPGILAGAYDLIAMLDVLEHVEDEVGALAAVRERLAPGGRLLLTVPAFPWMWSGHDVANHHHRRYTRRSLRRALRQAGFRLSFLSWFNSLLFPLAAASRIAARVSGSEESADRLPPAPLNKMFDFLFGIERYAIGLLPFPPGVSLVAIAEPSEAP